jgi:serine/threonine protein kinase
MNCNSLVPVQYFSNDPNPDMWWNNLTETMDVERVKNNQTSVEAPSSHLLDTPTLRLTDRYMISELEIKDGTKASIFFLDYLEKNYQLFKNTFITFENNDQLLRHKNGRTVALNAVQLMKITTKALTILKENQSTYIQLDAQSPQLLVSRQEADSLVIGHKIKELGCGVEGTVYLFDVVTLPIPMVAKFAVSGESSGESLENEITTLSILYGKTDKSSLEGIQDRIYSIFKIQEPAECNDADAECSYEKQGYITSYYNQGDANSVFPSENFRGAQALLAIRQLFEGIRHAHALNVVHGDIYAGNLLVRMERDKFEICLADWGWAYQDEDDILVKSLDIKNLCDTLYEILTGIVLKKDKKCTKTRQELLTFHATSKEDFLKCQERHGGFDPRRLQEVEIPNELIVLFDEAISCLSRKRCPKLEAFIQVIDRALSQRGSA